MCVCGVWCGSVWYCYCVYVLMCLKGLKQFEEETLFTLNNMKLSKQCVSRNLHFVGNVCCSRFLPSFQSEAFNQGGKTSMNSSVLLLITVLFLHGAAVKQQPCLFNDLLQ